MATRNSFEHGSSSAGKVLKGRDLYLATTLLILVMELHLLKAMKLGLRCIRSAMKRRIENLRIEYDGA